MTPKNNYQNAEQERRILWLEEHYSIFNNEMGEIKEKMVKIETDVSWLVKNYWVVATASIGALVGALINFLIR